MIKYGIDPHQTPKTAALDDDAGASCAEPNVEPDGAALTEPTEAQQDLPHQGRQVGGTASDPPMSRPPVQHRTPPDICDRAQPDDRGGLP